MNVGVIPKKVNIGNLNNMHAKKKISGKKDTITSKERAWFRQYGKN